MATVLVRRAAAQAGDSQALSAQLAAHFPDDVARREFDALLAGHAGPVEGGASAATLDTALVDDATRRLAAYVGPIARIVASRAASRTNDAGTFYLRLVDAVPDEKDKAALRRELGLSAD
jgi:serine/threonine-protein kinase